MAFAGVGERRVAPVSRILVSLSDLKCLRLWHRTYTSFVCVQRILQI